MERLRRSVARFVQAEPQEIWPLAWSFGYFFCLLCGYYILRPVRDEMAIQGGVHNLPWMMTGTFLTLLAVTPLFGWLSARYSRYRLLLAVYLFFIANLVGLYLLMTGQQYIEWVARGFFVWLSVFNLFVVSVFWSFMADLFTPAQGARLFGMIAAGGSTGALFGPLFTTGLTYLFPVPVLMLVSALFLLACIGCIYKLEAWSRGRTVSHRENSGEPLGGGFLAGIRLVWSSPYLLGIAAFILLYSTTSTFLYFQQATIAEANFPNGAARTAFFADIDFWVNVLTIVFQLFLTGRLTAWLGVTAMLCALPLFSVAGFAALAAPPTVAVFVVVQVARRVSNFALARPTREVLFTSVPREDRYKAKNFIDTVVYRGGDQVASWSYAGLLALGLGLTGIAIVAVPLSAAWLALSVWLGRKQESAEEAEVARVA
jgi:AAA family ATP:ADP antiporter